MTIWYLLSSLVMGFIGIVVYIYYLRKGQFQDSENVKYQIFHDEE